MLYHDAQSRSWHHDASYPNPNVAAAGGCNICCEEYQKSGLYNFFNSHYNIGYKPPPHLIINFAAEILTKTNIT
jgi:hypothetical protein